MFRKGDGKSFWENPEALFHSCLLLFYPLMNLAGGERDGEALLSRAEKGKEKKGEKGCRKKMEQRKKFLLLPHQDKSRTIVGSILTQVKAALAVA